MKKKLTVLLISFFMVSTISFSQVIPAGSITDTVKLTGNYALVAGGS